MRRWPGRLREQICHQGMEIENAGKNFSVKYNSVLTLRLSSGWSQEQHCGGASPLTSQTLHKHCINSIPSTSSRDKRLTRENALYQQVL
ncbi:hypothetical protein Q7C36_007784 [Tachysurus vachellii]|uniref:Uncharacterized protein n=1 Tax=Tachysurus vachellii TaxID=175792 RepID=A0AA88SV34_TACVA|nr:hypothetical protein Q7C36_007784 [Tachysurus vachellii]